MSIVVEHPDGAYVIYTKVSLPVRVLCVCVCVYVCVCVCVLSLDALACVPARTHPAPMKTSMKPWPHHAPHSFDGTFIPRQGTGHCRSCSRSPLPWKCRSESKGVITAVLCGFCSGLQTLLQPTGNGRGEGGGGGGGRSYVHTLMQNACFHSITYDGRFECSNLPAVTSGAVVCNSPPPPALSRSLWNLLFRSIFGQFRLSNAQIV